MRDPDILLTLTLIGLALALASVAGLLLGQRRVVPRYRLTDAQVARRFPGVSERMGRGARR